MVRVRTSRNTRAHVITAAKIITLIVNGLGHMNPSIIAAYDRICDLGICINIILAHFLYGADRLMRHLYSSRKLRDPRIDIVVHDWGDMAIVGILNVLIAYNSAKVHAFGIHELSPHVGQQGTYPQMQAGVAIKRFLCLGILCWET